VLVKRSGEGGAGEGWVRAGGGGWGAGEGGVMFVESGWEILCG
jgi:hypothetical protein